MVVLFFAGASSQAFTVLNNKSRASNLVATEATSGNMIVFSSEAKGRNVFLHHAEELRKQFLLKTGLPDHEEIPILILFSPDDSVSAHGVLRAEGTSSQFLKLQLDLKETLLSSLDSPWVISDLDSELVTAFFLQAIYQENRSLFSVGAPIISLPAWLTIGLTQSVQEERDLKPCPSLLLQQKPLLTAFLREEPPWDNPILLHMYAVQAQMLVESCFLMQKNRIAFQKALASLSRESWPRGWNQEEIENQWWRLMEEKNVFQKRQNNLSLITNIRQLQSLLITSVGKDKNVVTTPRGEMTTKELLLQLQAFRSASNPMEEEMLQEYFEFLRQFSKMPSIVISKNIAHFQERAASLAQRSQRIVDFLNWYEITRASTLREVLPFPVQSVRKNRSAPAVIEKYLDTMEARYK